MPRLSPDDENEYVDMYKSITGNRLLPNDGRNLNIFFIFKTTVALYFIVKPSVCCCIFNAFIKAGLNIALSIFRCGKIPQ